MGALSLNPATTARLQKVAEVEGTTIDELAERAIRQFLRDEARRLLQLESAAFRTMHADLMAHYAGQYVAIHQGQLVDHDADQLALLLRIEEKYPSMPVLIKKVTAEIEEVYTFRSPRLSHV